MIICRTPYRASFFGGGTDYPKWYLQHGGSVVGTAINKYCYITARRLPPFFEHKHRIVYSKIENVGSISEIEHPAVKAVLAECGVGDGLEIHHDGDLPARSGLGSSSSFTVGLLNSIQALNGKAMTKHQLAKEATRIEQEVIGEYVGSQDQVWAAYGGMNRIDFNTDGRIDVSPVLISHERKEELQSHILLIYTGISRFASNIAKGKIKCLDKKEANLKTMHSMVDEAVDILQNQKRNLHELGTLLDESWKLKRELTPEISDNEIDTLYQTALDGGAYGGKLLGAGGGGFLMVIIDPAKQQALIDKLSGLITVSVNVCVDGSKIVLYEPDGL